MSKNCGFFWVEQGHLAGSAYPGPCIDRLVQEQGIQAVVSLERLRPQDNMTAQALGLEITTIPILDYSAGTEEQRNQALKAIDGYLKEEKTTLVHCKGGLGRTGMILALYLTTRRGMSPQKAIARVRELRPGAIEPKTGQEDAIYATEEA